MLGVIRRIIVSLAVLELFRAAWERHPEPGLLLLLLRCWTASGLALLSRDDLDAMNGVVLAGSHMEA